ncbi:hypothetical protein IJ670_08490, partial [bacterium]|nr:hypothetical protein [bacterium]
ATIKACKLQTPLGIDKNNFQSFLYIHKLISSKLNEQKEKETEELERKSQKYANMEDLYSKIQMQRLKSAYKDFEKVPLRASDYTKRYFELSKTPNGFDFSNFDEKFELIQIFYSQLNVFDEYKADEIFKHIIEASKDESSRFDPVFASCVFEIDKSCDYTQSLDEICGFLHKYATKDRNSIKDIANTISSLLVSEDEVFYFNDDYFASFLELCFDNDEKFDSLKGRKIADYKTILSDAINERFSDFVQEEMDKEIVQEHFDYLRFEGFNLLTKYLRENEDENGRLIQDPEDFAEYLDLNFSE